MTELRIYYECLEQARHYMLPIIENAVARCGGKADIRLIRNINRTSGAPSSCCFKSICSLVVPDILLTAVNGDNEYPLALFEFSEAVITEDHELQKSYGVCAGFLSDIFYIKISGQKRSTHAFGGASYNPYSTPRILSDRLNYRGCIYAEWTVSDDSESLLRNAVYLSCPPRNALVDDAVAAAVKSVLHSPERWYERALSLCEKRESYRAYLAKVGAAPDANALLREWTKRQQRQGDAKARFRVGKDYIAAKINRMSHAMDPDRGILIFIALAFARTHKIFGIYALQRVRTKGMEKAVTLDSLAERLLLALSRDGAPEWFRRGAIRVAECSRRTNAILDFHPVFAHHAVQLRENKVMTTLAYFLDGIYLGHTGPLMAWNKRAFLGAGEDFHDALKNALGFRQHYTVTPLQEAKTNANEDEVTYSLVHDVLRPCGFLVVAVSYPGAQGGTPILPNPSMGKAQPREYIDTIASSPSDSFGVLLNESKGTFRQAAVNSDIRKITEYKHNPVKRAALRSTLLKLNCLGRDGKLHSIWAGVSFSADSDTTTSWKPSTIDFIFILIDRQRWRIGMFSDSLSEHIHSLHGHVSFPRIFEIRIAAPENTSSGKLNGKINAK